VNVLPRQVGIALVGVSSLLSGEGSAQVVVSPEQMLLGMGLIVASQVPSPCPAVALARTDTRPACFSHMLPVHPCLFSV
jgi:hypothetical protein